MKIASVATVKTQFSAYLKASEEGPVVLTRNGKPIAVLVAIDDEEELERLVLAHSPNLRALLDAAHRRVQAGRAVPHKDFWQEVETQKRPKKARRARARKS